MAGGSQHPQAAIADCLIASAGITLLVLTRSWWLPADLTLLIPATSAAPSSQPGCSLPLHLNSKGLWEGPWTAGSSSSSSGDNGGTDGSNSGGEKGAAAGAAAAAATWGGYKGGGRWTQQRKSVAVGTDEDDSRLKLEVVMAGLDRLQSSAEFNRSSPMVVALARIAEQWLAPWVKIEGVSSGLGHAGMIKAETLKAMPRHEKLISCIAHVRIVGGQVYYRYGSFLEDQKKIDRTNLQVKEIQNAITLFGLQDLKAELFLNACDRPLSFDNSLSPARSGFPVFSTQSTPGSIDIVAPDPLDLLPLATALPTTTEWDKREPKLVFRGSQFEWDLKPGSFGGSPRARLHFMSRTRPDLIDAAVAAWGPRDTQEAKDALVRRGFTLGLPMSLAEQQQRFRYRAVMDEAVGTRELCSALSSDQATVRHASGFFQFFDPLLLPGIHFMEVDRSLQNLVPAIEWMRENDKQVKVIVEKAKELADLVCSERSRLLYWSILLSKYESRALEDSSSISAPRVCEGGSPIATATEGNIPTCSTSSSPCSNFCVKDVDEAEWVWLAVAHA